LVALSVLLLLPALARPETAGDGAPSNGVTTVPPPRSTPETGAAPTGTVDRAEITKAQEHLKAAGFDPGNTDGVVDQPTERAIRQFQQAKGIPVTGRLDVQTRAALLEVGGLQNPGTYMDRT
jgi:peptidoglycan hydrolase-like protein with peptidoglycan-binding domain